MISPGSQTQVDLRKVLFATDFSSSSEVALRYGVGLSRRYDATLYMVSVVSAEITYDAQPPDPLYLRHSAENKMAKLADSELFQGIKHLELVEEAFGSVSRVLLELIERLHIDLIVLGTHGRGGIKKLVLGSVAEEIINRAPCAVLTVGPHVHAKLISEFKLQRILCATDLQPGSEKVLAYALWLAKDENAHVTLLHVLKIPTDAASKQREAQRDTAMKQLVQLLTPHTSPSLEVKPIVEIGAPGNASRRWLKATVQT